MSRSSRTVPGTGLSPILYGLLVLFSVALFLFWDGPLWAAKREASHVARFAVSYLAVLPAAALLLLAVRRLDWSHLIATTGSAWGIKLVVTSALYFALARGTGPNLPAASATATSRGPAVFAPDYRAAKGDFERGAIEGAVVTDKAAAPGAVVLIDKPRAGLPLSGDPAAVHLSIAASRYGEAIYVGRSDSDYSVSSSDSVLHTLHLYDGGRAVANVPVPAGGKPQALSALEPGVYEARCDTHASERGALVVTDHPYVTRADGEGRFALQGVPAGPVTLVVVWRRAGTETATLVRRIPARVETSETTVVHIDLSTPEVAEERL